MVSRSEDVVWEGTEEDEGDEVRLLYSSELDIVAPQDVTHDVMVLLEPHAMARFSGAFLAWSRGVSLN